MLLTQRCFQLCSTKLEIWKMTELRSNLMFTSWCPICKTQTCTGPLGVSTSIVGKTTFHSKSIAVFAVAKFILDLERFKTRYWEYMFMAIVMVWGAWAAKRFLVRRWFRFSRSDWTSALPGSVSRPRRLIPWLLPWTCIPSSEFWNVPCWSLR